MRLSEKGCVHLNEWAVHKLPIDAFEFKPEDFTGAVIATPLEHYNLRVAIWNAYGWLKCNNPETELALIHIKEASRKAEAIAKRSGCNFEPESLELDEEDKASSITLTVEEAKRIVCFIEGVNLIGDDLHQYIKHIFKPLKDGIEQAEVGNDR